MSFTTTKQEKAKEERNKAEKYAILFFSKAITDHQM
jgi:hypothetical protein